MGAHGSKGSGQVKRKKYKNHLIQSLDDHEGGVNCMALSDDGSVLATGKLITSYNAPTHISPRTFTIVFSVTQYIVMNSSFITNGFRQQRIYMFYRK